MPTGKRVGFFSLLEHSLRLDTIFEQGLPVRYIPYLLYLTGLGVFYIANRHYAEKTARKLEKTKVEVDDLRTDYTTLKADYMFASKQSEVARRIATQGLSESSVPPFKIIADKEK